MNAIMFTFGESNRVLNISASISHRLQTEYQTQWISLVILRLKIHIQKRTGDYSKHYAISDFYHKDTKNIRIGNMINRKSFKKGRFLDINQVGSYLTFINIRVLAC